MSDAREALAVALRHAADRCCQCTDGHHDQVPPYGTDDDVRISRDDARKIADILTESGEQSGERDATPDEAHDIGYSKGHADGYREAKAEHRPTPATSEAVEAAARASYESFMARMTRHFAEHGVTLPPARPWEEVSDRDRETFREDATAALVAAQRVLEEDR